MRDDYFRKACIDEARKGDYKFLLGAILVKRGKIVGRGYNVVCYTGGNRPYCNGIHAEISAINDASPTDREGAVMYVGRWRKSSSLGCAKPCPPCEKVLRKLGVKTIWYSDYGDVWRKMIL